MSYIPLASLVGRKRTPEDYVVSLPEWLMGVDLRSTGGNSAWVRTPQLTRPLGHARLAWRFETMYGSERARARLGDSACEGKSTNNFER